MARLLTSIRAWIHGLLTRRGLGPDTDVSRPDPVAEESPALARLSNELARLAALTPRPP